MAVVGYAANDGRQARTSPAQPSEDDTAADAAAVACAHAHTHKPVLLQPLTRFTSPSRTAVTAVNAAMSAESAAAPVSPMAHHGAYAWPQIGNR
ncbi:hypothetical protein NDU88_001540 [Pleurodeles waltl]|uniref:Uncharacterized protein n=1 Tax=Pleurodeles waltl TaxID=8319 RepID=A0AAV7RAN0_PLEWA|nr:hypothetical protein NDU88_001540 [Pleurodeles waltl]